MLGPLLLILATVAFGVVVVRLLEVPIGRRVLPRSAVHRRSPSVPRTGRAARLAKAPGKLTASWKLLIAIVLIAVGAALGAVLAIRWILGLLEGIVS